MSTPPRAPDDRAVLVRIVVGGGENDPTGTALATEELLDRLFALGATGVEETEDVDGSPVLLAGFANRPAAEVAVTGLPVEVAPTGLPVDAAPTIIDIPDDTWFHGWRAYARAQRAGRRLVVHPPWVPLVVDPPVRPDDVVLSIDPGRSFGSGAHPTTRLVLAALEDRVRPGSRVLDLGCGSGVLAIAAARLGATTVLAVDTDPAAVAATEDNARRNGVAFPVLAALPPQPGPDDRFDLLVANIGANTLVSLGPRLSRWAPVQVLSGFFHERAGDVAAAWASEGFRVTADTSDGDGWTVLVVARPTGGTVDHRSAVSR